MAHRDFERLDISDTEADLFASPSRSPSPTSPSRPSRSQRRPTDDDVPPPRMGESRYDAEAARTAALTRELESLRSTNGVIEDVIASLTRGRSNMGTVSQTVGSASTLLNTWTRMLSQTEHNQRLILDPGWKGASQDLVDAENEVVMKAQAAERKEAEERRRREEARSRAEDEERQRQAGTVLRGPRGRGRARGVGRAAGSVGGQRPASGLGRTPSQTGGRGGSGTGRGVGGTRGRARGVR